MFLFLAYKPNSDDYCWGCHMASYSSNFEIHSRIKSSEALISIWADIINRNKNLSVGEKGYEVQIYENGKCVYDDIYGGMSYEDFESEYPDNFVEICDQKVEAMLKLKEEAEKKATEQHQAKKEREQAQELLKQEKEEAAKKESRRKEYERLKNEFSQE